MKNNHKVLTTSAEHPFAHGMLTRVFPQLVQRTIDSRTLEDSRRVAAARLRDSLAAEGVVPEPGSRAGMAPKGIWARAAQCIGQPWVGLPSYVAESLFYYLFLDVLGFFDFDSMNYAADPFLPRKLEELEAAVAGLKGQSHGTESLQTLLAGSLWGNLGDSAHLQFHQNDTRSAETGHLLVDDSIRALDVLLDAESIGIILDNAGGELIADLALADGLLRNSPAMSLTLYLKQRPYFVSDATLNDFHITGTMLVAADAARFPVRNYLETGRLQLRAHWFFHSPAPPMIPWSSKETLTTVVFLEISLRRQVNRWHRWCHLWRRIL
jgi:hypothetical protein